MLAVINFFKGIWGKIAAGAVIAGVVLVAVAKGLMSVKQSGRDEQKVEEMEAEINQKEGFDERVTDAIEAESRLRNDIDSGRVQLREDDGYKRKPSGSKPSGTD